MPVYFTKFPIFTLVICICFSCCNSLPIQNDTLQGLLLIQASNFSTLLPINVNETQLIATNFTNYWSSSSLSSSLEEEKEESNSSMSITADPTLNITAISTVSYSATTHPNEPIENFEKSETEPDFELISEESNMNSTSQDIDLIQDDEDDDDETETEDEDYVVPIPSVLANLPHDIPPDRSIVEVLAENAVKDKQYDELRLEELLHELMTHSLGYGEFYPDEVEYDDIQVPMSRAERPGKKNGRKRHSRRSHVN